MIKFINKSMAQREYEKGYMIWNRALTVVNYCAMFQGSKA